MHTDQWTYPMLNTFRPACIYLYTIHTHTYIYICVYASKGETVPCFWSFSVSDLVNGGVGWVWGWGGDDTTHVSCSAAWSSLAFQHELDVPLLDLLLNFNMNLMLPCLIWGGVGWVLGGWGGDDTTHVSCSAAWSSLGFQHELDAPLLDLLLHFNMNLMFPCLIFSWIWTWTWCSAAWSSLAFEHKLDAPLLDLTRTWCSAVWSSLAVQHELDSPLLELLLHFNKNLMLRCMIFSCIWTWTWYSAAGCTEKKKAVLKGYTCMYFFSKRLLLEPNLLKKAKQEFWQRRLCWKWMQRPL